MPLDCSLRKYTTIISGKKYSDPNQYDQIYFPNIDKTGLFIMVMLSTASLPLRQNISRWKISRILELPFVIALYSGGCCMNRMSTYLYTLAYE